MENRLAKEKSPYLLQHASNPVDWYPWGEEAFAAAKREDKPIFLSIGYATCHWCHVMEKESFSDPNIAQMMNDIFICIKVDREELPHIDNLYMDFAQALLSSSGGWPLNVILTPDLKPFFAITYLPSHPRKGLIGLDQFIEHIQALWKGEERDQLIEQADHLVSIFKESFVGKGEELPTARDLEQSMQMFFELTDPINGGMKGEPKFPLSYLSDLLLSYGKKQNDSRAIFYVERSLQKMHSGGIYDHLGGGFSRYAVDAAWRVPHFEKMLCDNAVLAKTYLLTWKFTAEPFYKEVSSEILEYLLRDMKGAEGGFYSAEDADSEGKEGFFYTWTFSEIAEILSPEELEIFCAYYHVTLEGNFEGRNILYSTYSIKDFSQKAGMTEEALSEVLLECRKKLLTKRQTRTPPFKDDKRITAWNALMIDTLIHSAVAMEKEEYRKAALDCVNFLFSHLYKDGHLLRRYREKEARFSGTLDDYAFLIKALLSLFECGEGTRFLQLAIHFATILEEEFKVQGGGFYLSHDETHLVFQKCEFYDGAEPSGNGVHAENLLRLYQITQEEKYLLQAEDIFRAVKPYIEAYPPGCGYHLMALQRYLDQKSAVIIIALNEKEEGKETLSRLFYKNFLPSLSLIWKTVKDAGLVSLIPGLEDKVPIQGKTAVYICRQDGCEAPLTDLAEIEKAIHRL